jgi:hypothetical protein
VAPLLLLLLLLGLLLLGLRPRAPARWNVHAVFTSRVLLPSLAGRSCKTAMRSRWTAAAPAWSAAPPARCGAPSSGDTLNWRSTDARGAVGRPAVRGDGRHHADDAANRRVRGDGHPRRSLPRRAVRRPLCLPGPTGAHTKPPCSRLGPCG